MSKPKPIQSVYEVALDFRSGTLYKKYTGYVIRSTVADVLDVVYKKYGSRMDQCVLMSIHRIHREVL